MELARHRRLIAGAWALTGLLAAQPWAVPAVKAGSAVAAPGETVAAWDAYVRLTETRITKELADGRRFLARDFGPDGEAARRAASGGEVLVSPWQTPDPSGGSTDITGGRVHHWIGSVFVPGADLDVLLPRLRGTDVQARQPDVLQARVLRQSPPDGLTVFLRLRRSQIVTVTYDTEHRVHIVRLDRGRATSTTVATRIAEVEDPGLPTERERGADEDRGFLWRLNAYWRYLAVPGGVLVECESISLSRRAPLGFGVVAEPFVTRVARESMDRTLRAVRTALQRPAPPVGSAPRGAGPVTSSAGPGSR